LPPGRGRRYREERGDKRERREEKERKSAYIQQLVYRGKTEPAQANDVSEPPTAEVVSPGMRSHTGEE